ncbi:polysaccharide pyruvyl transferase family protein [Pseudomonas fulva]|uniref:Pyruvyltransferase n=1 Tax=Pseudomonas fulva (strain 12-X) TaxID=743720 RepID=F6AKQ9_PSEF1|nr:polysaccharide pyruvyl transferase family protein [Pseudomonas fulva]AEF24133.1 pyruvyltransferase [Pseudomonas fulva 12-X]
MTIKLYWHRGSGRDDPSKRNFGDFLSPLIVEAVAGRQVEYATLPSADMMAIGTILAKEPKAKRFGFKRRLHVWGSGCGQPGESFSGRHYYHAVRGGETRQRIEGGGAAPALGDPGLLSDILIDRPVAKKYRIGFVPHYVDQQLPEALAFLQSNPDVRFINVFDEPKSVLQQIASCDYVVSSSLHGLVVADSFGVPNVRVRLSQGIIDELKFDDYYSAFGIAAPLSVHSTELINFAAVIEARLQDYCRPGLDGVKGALLKSFPSI